MQPSNFGAVGDTMQNIHRILEQHSMQLRQIGSKRLHLLTRESAWRIFFPIFSSRCSTD